MFCFAVPRLLCALQRYEQVQKEKARLPIRLDDTHVYSSVTGAGAHSEIGSRPTMEVSID